ncbi:MAG: hypothetical protein K2L85_00590 [Paramuribaculum sp.]|nr:hypothetical protein [Paramuribaculum sp.]
MTGKKLRLLVVADSTDPVALTESEALRPVAEKIDFVAIPAERTGLLSPLCNRLGIKRAVKKTVSFYGTGYDAVLSYGAAAPRRMAAALSSSTAVTHVVREEFYSSVGCAVAPMGETSGHSTRDHALTFVSFDSSPTTVEMMVAMAVARPGSKISWLTVDAMPHLHAAGLGIPANLTVRTVASIEEALAVGAVDWTVDFGGNLTPPFHSLCQSLAAGVPVVAVGKDGVDEVFDDECCVMLGESPAKEEFVRGLLPYIDSDIRSQRMREGAKARWRTDHNPETVARRLIDEILDRLKNERS